MHERGYIDGNAGNITARLGERAILATPSGVAKGFLSPDQLIIVDMDGKRIDAPTPANAHLRPTSELFMHLECYQGRDDIHGVVHAHPPTSVALTLVGYDFQQCLVAEAVITLGFVPVVPYATPASAENRDLIRQRVQEHDAILLAHHGSLTVAETVWDAYLLLETLEQSARIIHMAQQLGTLRSIPPEQLEKLIEIRKRLGRWRPGDDARFANAMQRMTDETKR